MAEVCLVPVKVPVPETAPSTESVTAVPTTCTSSVVHVDAGSTPASKLTPYPWPLPMKKLMLPSGWIWRLNPQ